MYGTGWTHKSWSAAQKHQGANAPDGPGHLEVLVASRGGVARDGEAALIGDDDRLGPIL